VGEGIIECANAKFDQWADIIGHGYANFEVFHQFNQRDR